jgi:hypothetical protein
MRKQYATPNLTLQVVYADVITASDPTYVETKDFDTAWLSGTNE